MFGINNFCWLDIVVVWIYQIVLLYRMLFQSYNDLNKRVHNGMVYRLMFLLFVMVFSTEYKVDVFLVRGLLLYRCRIADRCNWEDLSHSFLSFSNSSLFRTRHDHTNFGNLSCISQMWKFALGMSCLRSLLARLQCGFLFSPTYKSHQARLYSGSV